MESEAERIDDFLGRFRHLVLANGDDWPQADSDALAAQIMLGFTCADLEQQISKLEGKPMNANDHHDATEEFLGQVEKLSCIDLRQPDVDPPMSRGEATAVCAAKRLADLGLRVETLELEAENEAAETVVNTE